MNASIKKYLPIIFVITAVSFISIFLSAFNKDPNIEIAQRQFTIPVLKQKKDNPVLLIKISLPAGSSQNLESMSFSTDGTSNLADIKNIRLFYSGNDSVSGSTGRFEKAVLFGESDHPGKTFSIKGKQLLEEGTHHFWLSFEISENAGLLNRISTECIKLTISAKQVNPSVLKEKKPLRIGIAVRKHLQDSVDTYRIPGLTTTNKGTLLAVYDARRESSRDLQGDIDIGLSRSIDGGNTWEPMRIAIDMGKWGGLPQKFNGVSDACILVDKKSGTIFLAGLWMYGVINDQGKWIEGLNETSKDWNHQWRNKGSQPGFDPKQTAQFLIVKSTDDGKTWSEPINLTRMCKKEDWWLWAPAPGHGITLEDGTLVFPTQGRDNNGEPFSNITYSRDGGKTWTTSSKAVREPTTENMAVQLPDGSIMLNMRANSNRTDSINNGRAVAITKDLGNTWTEHASSKKLLQESTCMASIHRHTWKENNKERSVLLFSNPNTKKGRHHITIKSSFDDGNTWPEKNFILLDELNGRGYSCITSVNDKTIGILYESSQADMVFQLVSVSELLK
jgi:sialidase-1